MTTDVSAYFADWKSYCNKHHNLLGCPVFKNYDEWEELWQENKLISTSSYVWLWYELLHFLDEMWRKKTILWRYIIICSNDVSVEEEFNTNRSNYPHDQYFKHTKIDYESRTDEGAVISPIDAKILLKQLQETSIDKLIYLSNLNHFDADTIKNIKEIMKRCFEKSINENKCINFSSS